MLVIPALRRQRTQEDAKFSMDYIARTCSQK
jgi:hypothetical protein